MYVSIDIETDGPAPGVNSMLALGAVAFPERGTAVSTFYEKLLPLDGAYQNTETMNWWTTQPEAWAEVNQDQREAVEVIFEFVHWCDTLVRDNGVKLIAVAWPAAFDFAFVNYYCHRFTGRNPLGFACVDIRSYANGLFGHSLYYGTPEDKIKSVAGEKRRDLRPHVAVDDAMEQGVLFMAMRASNLKA